MVGKPGQKLVICVWHVPYRRVQLKALTTRNAIQICFYAKAVDFPDAGSSEVDNFSEPRVP